MSECKVCNSPTEWNPRRNKYNMYCSKKCANVWHRKHGEKRYIKKNADWGTREAKKLEAIKQRKERYLWLKENWYSRDRVQTELGISFYFLQKIKKALQLEPEISGNHSEHFFSPEDFERIKNYSFPEDVIPHGYKTRSEIEKQFSLGAGGIDSKIARYRIKPRFKKFKMVGNGQRNIYRPEDIVEWLEEIERIKVKKNEERKRQTRDRNQRKRREYEQKISERRASILSKDVVSLEEAAKTLNISCKVMLGKLKRKRLKVKMGEYYWLRLDIEKLKKQMQEKADKVQKNKSCKKRPDDWTSWQSYEQKQKEKVQLFRDTGYCAGKPYNEQGLEENEELWKKHENGEIVHFNCADCGEHLPYYNFYFDPSYNKGRRNNCKSCARVKMTSAQPIKKTPSRFIATYTSSIKDSLTKKNKEYCILTATQIWHLIETHLGYNKDDLVKHIESKFTKRMKWSNHGRPENPNEFRWQLDHIKPRASFSYTSIKDDDFKECWSLENFMPIEAKMNYYKSNKKLMQKVQYDLRRAIKEGKQSLLFNHLPYSVEQLQEHFKSFGVRLDGCGKEWAIDHIVPQAAMGFQSFEDKNFQTLLALDNLQPLTKSQNSIKGSKYDGKYWYHNYDE